uniref:UDP-N-acetylglucosamine 2-epimerase n=1 Tax=Algoriphagus sp. TaxID=1872435 RepID=UPI0040478032
MTVKKICVITGSRAEYDLLKNLMKSISQDPDLLLQLICTNMHLSPEFGLTYKEIEADGFIINKKVEILLSSDTASGTAKSMGLASIGFADAFTDLKPDMLVILGDRYEILTAVSVGLIFNIPIAHIHGGEITEGAYDNSIRHAVTKMSNLHFTATKEYRNRVLQLGEEPQMVFNVGALGVENITQIKLMNREEFENSIGFKLRSKNLMITFHPVTLDNESSVKQVDSLLKALNEFPEVGLILTYPNSDSDGREIINRLKEFVKHNAERAVIFESLGQLRYFSALQYVNAVVGNSSSGIIEVPSFNIPTLNIGNRQSGRIAADSVINCSTDTLDIKNKLNLILESSGSKNAVVNPYQKSGTAEIILKELKLFLYDTRPNKGVKKFKDLI